MNVLGTRILFYFLLTFIISWGSLFLAIGPDVVLGVVSPPEERMPLLYLAMISGPALSGMGMIAWSHGQSGLRIFFKRLFRWNTRAVWYGIAIGTAPLAMVLALFFLSIFSPVFQAGILLIEDPAVLLLSGIAAGLTAGIFEEVGWTGFALPELNRQYGFHQSGLIIGILWGLWHFPLFSGSMALSGSVPPVLYIFVLLFSFLPPFRIIMAWVYEHTESLFLLILMHVSLTTALLTLQPEVIGMHAMAFDLMLALILWSVVAWIQRFN